jgi:hypothetical protein
MMRRSFPTGLYRRSFPAEYKLRIVTEYDACAGDGDKGGRDRSQGSGSSVTLTWKRCSSPSVKVSWTPGWASSRRTTVRIPDGQSDRSTRPVISVTSGWSPSSVPSAVTAGIDAPLLSPTTMLAISTVRDGR